MRWGLLALAALVAVVLEMTLLPLADVGGVRPLLVPTIALFVALSAPRLSALWACLLLGFVVDLTSPVVPPGGQVVHLLGPNALGYSFACALVLQVRGIVMKRQPIAVAAFSMLFVAASSIVVVAILAVRSWLTPEFAALAPAGDLLRRLGVAVATGLLAVPVGWFLIRTAEWWGFQPAAAFRTHWR